MISIVQNPAASVLPRLIVTPEILAVSGGVWSGNKSHRGVMYRDTTAVSELVYHYSIDHDSSFLGTNPPNKLTDESGTLTRVAKESASCDALFGNAKSKIYYRCNLDDVYGVYRYEITGSVTGSYSEYSASAVLAILDAEASNELYTEGNRNLESWWPHAEMLAIPYSNSETSGGRNCAAPVTARHIVTARHYHAQVGSVFTWKNIDNTTETRTVIGKASCLWSDLQVLTLNADLPAWADPFPIVGSWFADGGSNKRCSQFAGIFMNRNRQGGFVNVANIEDSEELGFVEATWRGLDYSNYRPSLFVSASLFQSSTLPDFYSLRNDFQCSGINGDSGLGIYVPVSGGWALAGPWLSTSGATRLYQDVVNECISASDENAITRGNMVAPTGYAVTVAPDPTL
jgi:hypothetical protein